METDDYPIADLPTQVVLDDPQPSVPPMPPNSPPFAPTPAEQFLMRHAETTSSSIEKLVSLINVLLAGFSVGQQPTSQPQTSAPPMPMSPFPPSKLPPGVKPPVPTTFDGAKKEEVTTWLSQTRATLQLANFRMDASTVAYAASFLTGRAAKWWKTCVATAPDHLKASGGFDTFEEFANKMKSSIGVPAPETKAREQLFKLRQLTSVVDYGEKFVDIIKELPNRDWRDLRFDYLHGLKLDIQEMLTGKIDDDTPWEEIHELARQCDELRMQQRTSRFHHPKFPSTPRSGPTPMDLDNLNVKTPSRPASPASTSRHRATTPPPRRPSMLLSTSAKLKPLTPETREECRVKNLCFRCRQPGHISTNCPKKDNLRPGFSRNVSPARKN